MRCGNAKPGATPAREFGGSLTLPLYHPPVRRRYHRAEVRQLRRARRNVGYNGVRLLLRDARWGAGRNLHNLTGVVAHVYGNAVLVQGYAAFMSATLSFEHTYLDARFTVELFVDGGSESDFDIAVSQEAAGAQSLVLTVSAHRKDAAPFVLERLRIAAWTPLVDIHGVWTGYGDRGPANAVPWRHESIVSTNTGIPLVVLMTRSGANQMAIGLLDQIQETRMVFSMEELSAGFEISYEKPLVPGGLNVSAVDEKVYISRRPGPWYGAVADYVETVDRHRGEAAPHVPPSAREPVYCSWYAIHHEATAGWVEGQMRTASELGFKTLIVDDGWFFPGHGKWAGYGLTGDWEVSGVKFPDFREHVKRVQDMGVKYLLWVSPFMVGVQSQAYSRLKGLMHPRDHGSFRCLCARNQEAQGHVAGLLNRLITNYGLDGFKLDFIDAVDPAPCTGEHVHDYVTHGEGMDAALGRIRSELSAVNPDVLLEFRQSYANLACRRHGTMFRAGDAPMDFDSNLWRITMVRSYAGAFPVHFDPAYWNPLESLEGVARHMMGSVFCVPMLSVDFQKLPADHLRIIKRWMDFYHAHKQLINFGRFQPDIASAAIESITITDDVNAVTGLFRGPLVPAPGAARSVELVNASNFTRLILPGEYSGWSYRVHGMFGELSGEGTVRDGVMEAGVGSSVTLARK